MSPEKTDVPRDRLTLVIPVYNEHEVIVEACRRLLRFCESASARLDVDLLFVDDGSDDSSLALLKEFAAASSRIRIVSFSRNFGHQVAITAGIDVATGDYVAIVDADLQDPPELVLDMYELARQGYDVVYGRRRSREGESALKKLTAGLFYRIFSYLCDTDVPTDTGDFRVMSRRAVVAFRQLRERHRFVRGMIPWCGFRSIGFEYDRAERFAGRTKYPPRKMLALAANAIFSFSKKPLRVAVVIGLATTIFGILLGAYMLYLKLFTDLPPKGVTAIMLVVILFGGIQILLTGLVGEYIARIFEEVKGRPLYLVAETINV